MSGMFSNTYEDDERARAYSSLEFPGTYYLGFRDLPALIAQHVEGGLALDFGCGAGRSTRFLEALGFETVGIDISPAMIQRAQAADPAGRYVLVDDGDYSPLEPQRFDLIFTAFAFDNIPGAEHRAGIMRRLQGLLRPRGRIVLLGCRAAMYVHEWASFTTKDFPENRSARSGDLVHAVMTDVDDQRPVTDVFWTDEDYAALFAQAGLGVVAHHMPLGRADEPFEWKTETSVAPFSIYVLGPRPGADA